MKNQSEKYFYFGAFLFLLTIFAGVFLFRPESSDVTRNRDVSSVMDYEKDIQPILNKRCVACHGCYSAPCQVKLSSYEGFKRGGHDKIRIFPPPICFATLLIFSPPRPMNCPFCILCHWRISYHEAVQCIY